MVRCFLSIHEAPGSIPNKTRIKHGGTGLMRHTPQGVEEGGFKVVLGYI